MARMALGQDDAFPQMAVPAMPPEQMAPVDPHDSLTFPISPAPVQMAAPKPLRMNELGGEYPDADTSAQPDPTLRMSAKPSPLDTVLASRMSRWAADKQKDADPYGSPDNHPGFFGKFLHGLNVATGGRSRRQYEEQGLEKGIQDIAKDQSAEGLQGAQTDEAGERTQGLRLANQEEPEESADKHRLTAAQSTNLESEAKDRDSAASNPTLAVAYSHAVNQAIKEGRDPATDPIVAHLSDAITSLQRQPTEKSLQHVSGTVNGKPKEANYHPDTGKFTDPDTGAEISGFAPPPQQPSYGQLILPTKTATYIGDNGLPMEYQWNAKSQRYDIPVGMSATNAYGHEAAQAGAVERAGQSLISTIQANRDKLGTLGAWVQKHGLDTPIADPTLAGIQSRLASFAALNPAMHGARGAQAMKHFEDVVGGVQKNPDALISSIQGILDTASNINPNTKPQSGNEQTPKVGETKKFSNGKTGRWDGKGWVAQ